jgi:hypothetical protein
MAVLAVKCHLFFEIFAFIFFLPLFTFKNERSAVDFSMCCDQN